MMRAGQPVGLASRPARPRLSRLRKSHNLAVIQIPRSVGGGPRDARCGRADVIAVQLRELPLPSCAAGGEAAHRRRPPGRQDGRGPALRHPRAHGLATVSRPSLSTGCPRIRGRHFLKSRRSHWKNSVISLGAGPLCPFVDVSSGTSYVFNKILYPEYSGSLLCARYWHYTFVSISEFT